MSKPDHYCAFCAQPVNEASRIEALEAELAAAREERDNTQADARRMLVAIRDWCDMTGWIDGACMELPVQALFDIKREHDDQDPNPEVTE